MSFEVTGKLVQKGETNQRTESFKVREFVIEKTEEIAGRSISNFIKFQSVQDKTALIDRYSIGEEIKVSFNLKGTKWMKDGRESYFTNLDAWRIESVNLNAASNQSQPIMDSEPVPDFLSIQETTDDLPF